CSSCPPSCYSSADSSGHPAEPEPAMRSVVFTLLLAIAALAFGGLVGWQLRQGNLDVLFGAPPTPTGDLLYKDFAPHDVKRIRVSGGGVSAYFKLTRNGWQAEEPWQDRMNPRAA